MELLTVCVSDLDGLQGRAEQGAEEAPGGLEAAVEIDRPGQGFERAGQDGDLLPAAALLLAPAEPDDLVELDLPGEPGQGQRARRRGLELGQLALVPAGEGRHREFGGDEAHDGIAEEFEDLVVLGAVGIGFVGVGAVGEGPEEQGPVAEGVADGLLQAFELLPVGFHGANG